jgi:hypothetical protein
MSFGMHITNVFMRRIVEVVKNEKEEPIACCAG